MQMWDDAPCLIITDNGQGVSVDHVDQLFEPFHTSDSKSTGLGLFLVKEYCTQNNADIEYFESSNRHGFRIIFQPPAVDLAPDRPQLIT